MKGRRNTASSSLTLLILVSLLLNSYTAIGSVASPAQSEQTLAVSNFRPLAEKEFLATRSFQSATVPAAARNETESWKQYAQRKPDYAGIKLTIDGKLLNLRDGLDAIYAHYKNRQSDQFLIGRMQPQLYEKIALRGMELRNSRVTFDNFGTAAFPTNPSWSEDPFKDRNWQWSLHNLVIVRYLLAAHGKTNDDWYLKRAEDLTIDWMNDNLVDVPPSEFSWNDHTTALRLENLIYLFEYARKREVSQPFLQSLLAAIYVHCQVLSDESFYNKHTNHGLDQSYILYWAGAVFPEFVGAARWREIGRERVKDEITFEFSSEGVHVENTPTYHFWIFNKAVEIDQIFRNYSGESVYAGMKDLADHALEYTAYVTKPDGGYPLLGDAEDYRPEDNKTLQALKNLPGYQHFLYSVTQGKEGVAPPQADRAFQKSGYAIFRDSWHTKSDFAQSVYLIFKSGFLSHTHKHEDDLSFVLYGYGEDWIIDSGLYRYQSDDPLRLYALSNRAHNLVLIDDLEMGLQESDVGKSHIDAFESNERHASVKGSHSLYPEILTERRVDYYKPSKIRITDTVSPKDDKVHTYRVLFHVPDNKEVTVMGQRVVIRSKKSGRILTISSSRERFNVYTISGQKEPYYQGWVSTNYRKVEKSVCVVFETKEKRLNSIIDLKFE